jgi:hypothetical protein
MHCPAASWEVIAREISAILLIGVKAVGYLAMSVWSQYDPSQTRKGTIAAPAV